MKTILYTAIICLMVLMLGIAAPVGIPRALAQDSESLSDMPPEAANDPDAKGPCPPAYIKLVSPRAAAVGATVSIQGWRFGKDPGQVVFPNGAAAKIISWRYQNIDVEVPDGAVSGNITVTTACGSVNKKGAGSYFNVMGAAKAK